LHFQNPPKKIIIVYIIKIKPFIKSDPPKYNMATELSTRKIDIVQKFRIRAFGPIFKICKPKINAALNNTIIKTDRYRKNCTLKI